jgi:hypothetical protein
LIKLRTWLQKIGMLAVNPMEADLQRTLIGRLVSALTFIAVVFCLGLWITAFLLFRQSDLQTAVSSNLFTNLSCITFFGGLVIAIGTGALVGNFLRRILWKWLMGPRS